MGNLSAFNIRLIKLGTNFLQDAYNGGGETRRNAVYCTIILVHINDKSSVALLIMASCYAIILRYRSVRNNAARTRNRLRANTINV